FSRRERSPFTLIATAATLAAGARNPMSDVLGSDVMWRRAITPGEGFSLGGGANAELFIVPGKVPLYLEGDNHEIAGESAANVGVEISACAKDSFTRPARRRSRRRLGLERDRTTNMARTIPARST
ncbi:MAG: hypothetical protein WB686_03370, partial [Pseudolabrys sp.]